MEINRQVRYNRYVVGEREEQNLVPHRWVFMIVNEPREIGRIRNRIYEQLQPIVDLRELDSRGINNSGGLHYQIFCFSSSESSIDCSEVYRGKFLRDRDLSEKSDIELVPYISSVVRGRR